MKIMQRFTAWSFGLLLLLAVAAPVLATEVVTYYHLDAAGTTVATTNSSGTLLWREHYYPYGERLKTDAAAAASTNPLWYTGQVEDNDAGLMYYGARWYNPQIGRFMSMDPAGVDLNNVQSFNRYAYANNNPYRFVDPDGRIPIPVIFALGRAVYPLLVAGVDAWALSADAPGTRGGFAKTPVADGVQQGIATARMDAGVAKGITRSVDDLSSLRGAKLSDVEKMADAKYLESGWTKAPLKDGNGIRYYDGKGNSFQLNNGYPGGKEMHGGPYIKTTQGNQTVRIPLEGNPDL